jgi:molybdenum cofactor guanylyltransferase
MMNLQNTMTEISCAILAGGKNSRMGRNKAILMYQGESFIEHIADVFSFFQSTIIISNEIDIYNSVKLKVYKDIFRECGPLGGIHAALSNSEANYVFIISCDLPLVTTGIIEYLTNYIDRNTDVIIPSLQNTTQPLCAIYSREIIPLLEKFLTGGGRKVRDFLITVRTKVVSFDAFEFIDSINPFISINTPDEYKKLISEAKNG